MSGNTVMELQQIGNCKAFLECLLYLEGGALAIPITFAMWDFGYDLAGMLEAC